MAGDETSTEDTNTAAWAAKAESSARRRLRGELVLLERQGPHAVPRGLTLGRELPVSGAHMKSVRCGAPTTVPDRLFGRRMLRTATSTGTATGCEYAEETRPV